jgi:hypothetical protein
MTTGTRTWAIWTIPGNDVANGFEVRGLPVWAWPGGRLVHRLDLLVKIPWQGKVPRTYAKEGIPPRLVILSGLLLYSVHWR